MKPPYRIAISVPCRTECKSHFALDLARLVGYTHTVYSVEGLALHFQEGTLIAPQRVSLVDRALRIGMTHILWLDDDMRFPKNALERLLSHERSIVGVNYAARRFPYGPTTFKTVVEGPPSSVTRLYTDSESEGLEQCDSLGFGVCLTEMEVFRKMEQPWFAVGFSPIDEDYQGEDVFFALRAAKAGYDLWCDHDLSKLVRHIGSMEYTTESSLALREMENDHNVQ